MIQRYHGTIVRLRLALLGCSPVRAAEAGHPAGDARLPPDRRLCERGIGSPLSAEQLEAIPGGIGGSKEKVHMPLRAINVYAQLHVPGFTGIRSITAVRAASGTLFIDFVPN